MPLLTSSHAQGSAGNTPLHFACMLEKGKHAALLLEYGAVPDARNEHGQTPLDLLPRDAVRSTKLSFKRMFDVSLSLYPGVLAGPVGQFCANFNIHFFTLLFVTNRTLSPRLPLLP